MCTSVSEMVLLSSIQVAYITKEVMNKVAKFIFLFKKSIFLENGIVSYLCDRTQAIFYSKFSFKLV